MAGSTLLRDGSTRGLWLRDRGPWLMRFMRQVVVRCTCSVASSNMGSMKMDTPQITAPVGVT